ncbi:amidohydrolase family protein [Demequina sp. B12]|uniref:amidohydrolase n=1 Tax=Demequina sp. B12 TaxID=2992757 RepID=UPI00237A70C8|nr:amidohydrolase family protein [Demequina sp. B12]MDE0573104.1 amidohydrolase family protein [Demequina sp. B12]
MTSWYLDNVRVVGADAPTALVIRDGVLQAPGSDTSGLERLDLDGRWVMPGLWDKHVHFTQWAIVRRRLDVSQATSAHAAAQIVAARLVAEYNHSEPLIGFGFRDSLWDDHANAEVLDAVAPERPVVLLSGDMHACWVNSAAQRRFQLSTAGLVREHEAFALQMRLDREAPGDEDVAFSSAAADAASKGIVGIVDLEMAQNLDGWAHRISHGLHAFRVRSGFYPQEFDARIAAGLRTGATIEGTNGLLSIGPLKLITDGSLNTRTAYCHEPYPGTSHHGDLTISADDTAQYLSRATDAGFSVAVHALGDAAVTHALDAFRDTGAQGSVEHAQLVAHTDLARFRESGVTASVQPAHLWDDRDATAKHWHDRADRCFPFASLRAAGAQIVLGSDAPVAPLDPWRAIAAAVHRSADDREPWNQTEALTRAEALAASVDGRSLQPGDPADLIALEDNPLACTPEELMDMAVAATVVGGEFTHWSL